MPARLDQHLVEDVAIDEPDKAGAFGLLDEVASGDRAASGVAQAQQAFVIIDRAGGRRNHRLERENYAALAQRRLHPLADRRA